MYTLLYLIIYIYDRFKNKGLALSFVVLLCCHIGEIIIYTRKTVDVVLPNQWDDVIYVNVRVSFLISTRNTK